MTDPGRRIAAFDVDGTLTSRDCVVPFLRRIAGGRHVAAGLARSAPVLVRDAVRRDRDALKAAAADAALRGRPLSEVSELGREFAADVHRRWMRPDTVGTLETHRAGGDTVVLVSASFEVYLVPLGELLGVDHVIGTRLAVHPAGVLTGGLDGANCRGAEKVHRLHEWLDARHGGRRAVHVVAYGNSSGDCEMLADADEAHRVGRAR